MLKKQKKKRTKTYLNIILLISWSFNFFSLNLSAYDPVANDSLELARLYDKLSTPQYIQGKELIKLLKVTPGSFVLDLGCGTGRLTAYLKELVGPKGWVIGMDPSPYRIEIAKQRMKEGLSFQLGRSEDLGVFKDNFFDFVYLNSVFYWIRDKETALVEIYRILKPGGKLGITSGYKFENSPLLKIVNDAIMEVMGKEFASKGMMNEDSFSKEDFKELLQESGFFIIHFEQKEYADYFPSPKDVVQFFKASSNGNLLEDIPQTKRASILSKIETRLERLRSSKGIKIIHWTILAVCQKPL
ncbi:hypothetical protein A946_04025 [Methylacidiphilum kamchatkense Kam1]|uniref:Methyltransferase type 11 domain-containing protein n=1 Tax=Methylacidiphilum kamchatkense Kam1 TaxID=1202785 RepID=A0ABR4ZY07_9BACT|nr:hypothetical protein A946_04025 [Methylacidiphilum kamchatkense Kam1]